MTYSSVFGSSEIYEVLNMLSRKAYTIFPESAVLLHTSYRGQNQTLWPVIPKKLLLNDPVIFYENSHQDLESNF